MTLAAHSPTSCLPSPIGPLSGNFWGRSGMSLRHRTLGKLQRSLLLHSQLIHHRPHPLLADVGVHLGGGDVLMAQQHLNVLESVPTKVREVPQDLCDVFEMQRKVGDLLSLKSFIQPDQSVGSKIR